MPRPPHAPLAAVALLALLAACGETPQEESGGPTAAAREAEEQHAPLVEWLGFEPPPTAKTEVLFALWDDARTPRAASDGGGSARFADGPPTVAVGRPARFAIDFTVGPEGLAEGGALYLQAPPFWGWSTPQAENPAAPGYTTVATDAAGVDFDARAVDTQLLAATVVGAPLPPGAVVRLEYGAGSAGARPDRYGERHERLWLAVDGDGDGVRALVDDAELSFDVAPGPPARVLLHLPATAYPGSTIEATLAVVDAGGSARVRFEGALEIDGLPGREEPLRLAFEPSEAAHAKLPIELPEESTTLRLIARAVGEDGAVLTETESNPCRVSGARRVLFGDLQGHTGLSDGTGTPDDYFTYARWVAGLDAVALTDHDRWGLAPLDEHPALWRTIVDAAEAHDDPGAFLALTGFEWTSWLFGHRHVVHFGDERPLYSSFDRAYDTPGELWSALRGTDALSIPHTLAGGPVAVDWSQPPPPSIEPVVELVSVHGSSDSASDPRRIYAPVDGHWFTDVLERGYRYGVIGSGDGHDGHPGLAHLAAPSGGIAGILAEDLTRAALLEALRARRCYATSGARIVLRTSLAGRPMGSTVAAAELGDEPTLLVEIFGTAPLARVEVLGARDVLVAVDGDGQRDFRALLPLPALAAGDLVRVRAFQSDRHGVWSSAYFVE